MIIIAALAIALMAPDPFDPGPNPLLMRHPTMNATTVVFQFAGDLWSAPREGGEAKRVTTAPGIESNPYFSPDGKWLAFSGQYDGNVDVYVVPAEGGVPKRLTAHPTADNVIGWARDGKSVLFSSTMLSNTDNPRMFTVSIDGGVPKPLPFPSGRSGCFSPDGKQIAYVPLIRWQEAWKRYRGGQASPIWIGALSDSKVKPIPRTGANYEYPIWVGDSIYFLGDQRGPVGMYRYDVGSGKITEEIQGVGLDLKSASAGPGGIVYERLGSLNIFDPKTHTSKRIPIEINGDFPEVREQYKPMNLSGFSLSPSGSRIAAIARGHIFTIPAAKGDIRQISEGQGIHRKTPAWSPDGKTIAWITDENRKQQLALCGVASGAKRILDLAEPPAVYNAPSWSPDSKKIVYTDNRLTIWLLDVASGKNAKVDTGVSRARVSLDTAWSPDSRWIAYTRDLENHYGAIFLYSLDSGKATQITDGLADANSPAFDRDARQLYFTASTELGQSADYEDISSQNNPFVTSNVYSVVLQKDAPNPLQPESDEEGVVKKAPGAPEPFRIDLDNIRRRIITLPMPPGNYGPIEPGPPGSFFIASSPFDGSGPGSLQKFSFTTRKAAPFATGVGQYQTNADGSKILLRGMAGLTIVPTAAPAADPAAPPVNTAGVTAKIDPRAEWQHMYHEVWDQERMLLYDPGLHGVNADVMEKRYEPFLANIASRDDLNYLFTDMLGELSVGHMFIGGGDIPGARGVPGGLLGVDYTLENGHYRLTRIYDGELWNPGLVGPMAQPGVNAQVGEYLLSIDGHDLSDSMDIYDALERKAGKQVKVKLGPNADGSSSREVTVVPVASEFALRFRAWSEDNRRLVEKMTGGRSGYMHIPDTGGGGWTEFNRYYFAQAGKDAMIVDDRFNHGGAIDDFMVREMKRTIDFGGITRHGKDFPIPPTGIFGPKVMLINEAAGSGGDIFPYIFRMYKTGPLVGKRTWGAMISAYGFSLVDGGSVRAPDDAMYDPHTGKWVIEGYGTPPDIDVELDPYLWRQGRDAQLEAAIAEMKRLLAGYHPVIKRPTYPDKTKLPPPGG